MRFSMILPMQILRSTSTGITRAFRKIGQLALAATICITSIAYADVTFTYELSGADTDKAVKTFSINKFYARIDDPAQKDGYLLYQAGKFFPLFSVNDADKAYTQLTEEVIPFMSPQSRKHHGADKATAEKEPQQTSENEKKPLSSLKATKKTRKVSGIECRVIHELEDKKPVMEHCMADSSRLGITEREVITMARTFKMARDRDFGWLGTGTEDEEFISVQSKDLRDNKTLTLTAVSTAPLPADYFRIPREYKEVKTEKSAASTKATAK